MSERQESERELVYCHSCHDEWYKDQGGLQCPGCGSDIVEIIQSDTDPRDPHEPFDDSPMEFEQRIPHPDHPQEQHQHNHPLHNHNPWGGDAPDPDDPDISTVQWTGPGGSRFSRTTFRSTSPPRAQDPFPSLFQNIFGGLPSGIPVTNGPNVGTGNARNIPNAGNTRIGGATYTFSVGRPGHMRFTRTGQFGNGGDMDDLNGIMGNLLGVLGPNAPPTRVAGMPPGAPINDMMRMLLGLVPPLSGSAGDVAYTEEGFDRIMSMLREQDPHSDAPGPASAAAIEALPRIKITKEQLDEQGKAECSICMDTVDIGTEVTELPCKHWFHHECISSWLNEHDTCPQCRRGITPKDGDQHTPRTTGQAPRYWRPREADLESLARAASNSSQNQAGSSSASAASGQPQQSSGSRSIPGVQTGMQASQHAPRNNQDHSRMAGVAGFISQLGNRLRGSGSGHGNNNDSHS